MLFLYVLLVILLFGSVQSHVNCGNHLLSGYRRHLDATFNNTDTNSTDNTTPPSTPPTDGGSTPPGTVELIMVPQLYGIDVLKGRFVNVWEANQTGNVAPIRVTFEIGIAKNPEYICNAPDQIVNTCNIWQNLGLSNCDPNYICQPHDVVTPQMITILQDRLNWVTEKLKLTFQLKPVADSINYANITGFDIAINSTQTSIASNVDLLVFITMFPNAAQVSGFSQCVQQDQYSRCTVGYINWVPGTVSIPTSSTYNSITKDRETLLHETFHLLGAVIGDNKVIDPLTGQLQSPNNVYVDATWGNYFPQVVRQIITPKALQIARNQTGCDTLPGIPLEDLLLGANFHWEARILGPELMAYGYASGESYLSDLTLAYVEDIGHMIANYSSAGPLMEPTKDTFLLVTNVNFLDFGATQTSQLVGYDTSALLVNRSRGYLRWGRDLGCDFFEGSPLNWPSFYLCNTNNAKGCTPDNREAAQCVLRDNPFSLPQQESYFSDPGLGGYSAAMDNVPIYQAYLSCKDVVSSSAAADTTGYTEAQLQQYQIVSNIRTYGGQEFCENCRCFSSTLMTISQNLFKGSVSQYGLCYRTNCVHSNYIQVFISGYWFSCPPQGGKVYIPSMTGYLVCPVAKDFCSQETQTGLYYPVTSITTLWIFISIPFIGGPLFLFFGYIFPDQRKWITRHFRHFFGITATSTKDGLIGGEMVYDWKTTENQILRGLIVASSIFFIFFAIALTAIGILLYIDQIPGYPEAIAELVIVMALFPILALTSISKGKPSTRIVLYLYFCFIFGFVGMFVIGYKNGMQKLLVTQVQENWEIWKYLIVKTNSTLASMDNISYNDMAIPVYRYWWIVTLICSSFLTFGSLGMIGVWRLLRTRVLVHVFFNMANICLIIGGPILINSIFKTLLPLSLNVTMYLIVPITCLIPCALFGIYGHYRFNEEILNIYCAMIITLSIWLGGATIFSIIESPNINLVTNALSDQDIGYLYASYSNTIGGIMTKDKLITTIDNYSVFLQVILITINIILLLLSICIIYIAKDITKVFDSKLVREMEMVSHNVQGAMFMKNPAFGVSKVQIENIDEI